MFETLTDRFQGILRNLTGQARITPDNIRESMREVRRALLEADVPVAVAKEFVARVEERAVGDEVLKNLKPGQQVVGHRARGAGAPARQRARHARGFAAPARR